MSDSRRSTEELGVAAALLCLALAPVISGCGSTLTERSSGGVSGLPEWKPFRYASPGPGVPWRIKPDKADAIPGERQPGVPAALQPVASSLTLPQLLAVALDNTPATRQAWEQARSAAAAWGAARGEYYPAATIGAQGLVSRGSSTASTSTAVVVGVGSPERVVAGLANITLSYLLLDFGGRRGRADSAEQALVGANWNHSQVIQDVARNVARAYHSYVGAKSQVVASRATLDEAQTSLEAVEVRRLSGVATVADLYQAQSNVAQARLALERDQGNVDTGRGVLATAVGWPANTPFDVAAMDDVPMDVFDRSVDDLIEEAQRRRPDLAAVRAFVRRKEADLRQAESARWPTLSSVMSVGTITVDGSIPPGNDPNYIAGLQIQIPVFQGGALDNAVRGARQDVEAARAALQLQSDVVVSDVWNTYINVRTASQQIISSQALVRSAELAYEAALARYRAGATNIVELVTVQSTLAGARSQQVQARTNLYTSYAELLRAVGMVPPGAMPAAGPAPSSRETAERQRGTGPEVTGLAPTRRWSVAVLAGLLLLAACERKKEAAPPPPPSLKVATAVQKSVPLYGEFVGTLVGVKTVDIRARVEGFLAKRDFVDGADVKEGQLLFVIDQQPFLAALAQAVAQLARDEANHAQAKAQLAQSVANLAKAEAQLAGDEANLSYAREQVERYRPLAKREFVTTEAFHQTETLARGAAATVESDKAAIKAAAAAADASRAAVDQAAATIQADRAAITQAELNLSYTTMYAPMAGRIGRRQVDVGNLVGAGQSTLLATIVQLDPIYVYFAVPERDARNLLTQRAGGFPVTVTMAGQAPHPQPGRVDFVNNTVDPTTGTFQVRATVANAERLLLPGQYAQVRLLMGTRPDAVLVPERAIVEEQGGQIVFVVGPDKKVQRRTVTAGPASEGLRIIEKGLKAGEDVLVDGLQRVQQGTVVEPKR